MTQGVVKFFDSGKHFGFINGDDSKSYYFHESQLAQGLRVTDGDKVTFNGIQGDRGPKAEKVEGFAKEEMKAEPENPAATLPIPKADDDDEGGGDGDGDGDEEEFKMEEPA